MGQTTKRGWSANMSWYKKAQEYARIVPPQTFSIQSVTSYVSNNGDRYLEVSFTVDGQPKRERFKNLSNSPFIEKKTKGYWKSIANEPANENGFNVKHWQFYNKLDDNYEAPDNGGPDGFLQVKEPERPIRPQPSEQGQQLSFLEDI